MKTIMNMVLLLVMFEIVGYAQINTESINVDFLETVMEREETNLSYLKQKQGNSSDIIPIPIGEEKYKSIPVKISFPNGTITDNSTVLITNESDFYYNGIIIHSGGRFWGRGHFENGRYMIKITYYNGTPVDFDIFDKIDWKLGVHIDVTSANNRKSRSAFKAEISIGTFAKMSAEVEQTNDGSTYIRVKDNDLFPAHMLPNYVN